MKFSAGTAAAWAAEVDAGIQANVNAMMGPKDGVIVAGATDGIDWNSVLGGGTPIPNEPLPDGPIRDRLGEKILNIKKDPIEGLKGTAKALTTRAVQSLLQASGYAAGADPNLAMAEGFGWVPAGTGESIRQGSVGIRMPYAQYSNSIQADAGDLTDAALLIGGGYGLARGAVGLGLRITSGGDLLSAGRLNTSPYALTDGVAASASADAAGLGSGINPRLTQRLEAWRSYEANGGEMSLQRWVQATQRQYGGETAGYRSGYASWSSQIESVHGNSLLAGGSHDVYVIREAGSGKLLHFGETGRGYLTRFAEHQRDYAKLGLEIDVNLLRTVDGKSAAKALETRYIQTYTKTFGLRPAYNYSNH